MAELDQLEEWGPFARRNFKNPPDIRVGRRLVRDGHIPGRMIAGDPWVYWLRFELNQAPDPGEEILHILGAAE